MVEFLDLPLECVEIIVSHLDKPSLKQTSKTCKNLLWITTPILFQHISLDLTVPALIPLSNHRLSFIKSLNITAPPTILTLPTPLSCTTDLDFFSPAKLTKLQKLSVSGNFVRGLATTLTGFQQPLDLSLQNTNLLSLVDLLENLPATVNENISSLSIYACSLDGHLRSADFARLALKLSELTTLKYFALIFNKDFDLCDDPALEQHISAVFAGLSSNSVRTVKVKNFPPYLQFRPANLPAATESFTFAANELDAEDAFLGELLVQCPAADSLRHLSLNFNHSTDDEMFYVGNMPATTTQIATGSGMLQKLTSVRLQIPSLEQVLQCLIPVNPHLQSIKVHNPSPAALVPIFSNSCLPDSLEKLVISMSESREFYELEEDDEEKNNNNEESIPADPANDYCNDDLTGLFSSLLERPPAWQYNEFILDKLGGFKNLKVLALPCFKILEQPITASPVNAFLVS